DQEVEDEREAEREEDEPPVPERAQQLVLDVDAVGPFSPAVSSRNASSRPAPLISMSRASGKRSSSARIATSESEQARMIASPRRSARVTPGKSASPSASAPGRVARIERVPTIALI